LAPIVDANQPSITTDEDIEKYFVTYLMDGSLEDNEEYKYATFINGGYYKIFLSEMFGGRNEITVKVPNQIQWCIDHYKKKGFGNNHCVIQIGYPESNLVYDKPYETETERGTSPCLRLIDTKIFDNTLHFHIIFRSWDLFGGFPVNMGGFVMLMEYMANELGVEVGTLSFSCLKLHCYDFQLEAVASRLGKIE
jgi:thymidylate synthase